ncbi:replication initiator protein A [Streptobacillus felis]|uniref:replication initiator protein A n=1 Tax=Streptobacillus felis TaxID=1384509 RepID=UPI00082B657E|nr:replication initiator protein A [Streptobacillus felis]
MSDYYYESDEIFDGYLLMPKSLIKKEPYRFISDGAKIIYCLMREKSFVEKESGKSFIFFQKTEIQEVLNVSKKKATKIIKELENVNLLEKIKDIKKGTNIYYIKHSI